MVKKTGILKIFWIVALLLVVSFIAFQFYQRIYANNINLADKDVFYLYIPSNSSFKSVSDSLGKNNVLLKLNSFKWVAQKKNYPNKIKAGRYEIKNGLSNNELINMLRVGNQKPVKLTFNSIRTKYELAGKIANQLEFDSIALIELLNNKKFLMAYGFNAESVISMFIPNTYQVYWNMKPEDFFIKMNKEYNKFWNESRLKKLSNIKMNKLQVSTLASIVQAEQSVHREEQPTVAGVYINRLKIGMHLESCPTLVYAIGDFTRQRILNKDMEIESPYNTYKYPGLPPAPINLPEISSIDAVLNYAKHDYIFFCARDDFSGYHYFSTNFTQHNIHARKYQLALNKKGIKH